MGAPLSLIAPLAWWPNGTESLIAVACCPSRSLARIRIRGRLQVCGGPNLGEPIYRKTFFRITIFNRLISAGSHFFLSFLLLSVVLAFFLSFFLASSCRSCFLSFFLAYLYRFCFIRFFLSFADLGFL